MGLLAAGLVLALGVAVGMSMRRPSATTAVALSTSTTTRTAATTTPVPTTPPVRSNQTPSLVGPCDGTTEVLELGGSSDVDGGDMPEEIWAAPPMLCGEVAKTPWALHGLVVPQEGARLPDIWAGMEWNWARFPVSGFQHSQASPALAGPELPPFSLLTVWPMPILAEEGSALFLIGAVSPSVAQLEMVDINDLSSGVPLSDGAATNGVRFFVVIARDWEREKLPDRLIARDAAGNVIGRLLGGDNGYNLVPEGRLDGE